VEGDSGDELQGLLHAKQVLYAELHPQPNKVS
jgi:hypothetical protein